MRLGVIISGRKPQASPAWRPADLLFRNAICAPVGINRNVALKIRELPLINRSSPPQKLEWLQTATVGSPSVRLLMTPNSMNSARMSSHLQRFCRRVGSEISML
jgi:hypothetical protein